MDYVYVDSKAVDQIGYDEKEEELHVVFKNGRTCIYSNVPAEVYQEFVDCDSKGTFLNSVIKARGYAYRYG